jgi:hypothetical protein
MTSAANCQLPTSNSAISLRQRLGCWCNERWRAELALRFSPIAKRLGLSWLDLCNRNEKLESDPQTGGRICHWADSSQLTVARVFPHVGAELLNLCLRDWPVRFEQHGAPSPPENPEVSVVIGVRGTGRLPQFQACLASLRAQQGVVCEVIVVEQSWVPEFRELCPPDVVYVHSKTTSPEMPFNRSWGLNVGAVSSRGRYLVLHDADMVVPVNFASSIAERLRSGLDAVRLARFIFYLDQNSSERIWTTHKFVNVREVSRVVENNPTPVAVVRDRYFQIGGHDESFFGWGGEDNEFMSRLRTLQLSEGAFLPIFHLWHPEAPNRSGDRNASHLAKRLMSPAAERCRQLVSVPFGQKSPASIDAVSAKLSD